MPDPPTPGLGQPVRESFRVLGVYIRGQFLLCLILAVLYSIAFWAVNVPYWCVIGPLGGVAAVIPRIGSLLSLGMAIVAIDFHSPVQRYVLILCVWLVIQVIEFAVLIPRLISGPLGLKEWPVILALLLGSLVFGPLGLVFAVPVLAIGLVFWRHFRSRRHPKSAVR